MHQRIMAKQIFGILLFLAALALSAQAESLPRIRWMKKKTDMLGFTGREKKFMVDMHNAYRSAVAKRQYGAKNGATNMRRMVSWTRTKAKLHGINSH